MRRRDGDGHGRFEVGDDAPHKRPHGNQVAGCAAKHIFGRGAHGHRRQCAGRDHRAETWNGDDAQPRQQAGGAAQGRAEAGRLRGDLEAAGRQLADERAISLVWSSKTFLSLSIIEPSLINSSSFSMMA